MLKQLIKITMFFSLLIILLTALPLSAEDDDDDDEGVNSSLVGLTLHAAGGYGQNVFGIIENSKDNGDLGIGAGKAFEAGTLLNISILAFGANFTQAYYDTLKWEETVGNTKVEYESHGNGYFRTLELIGGLKLFTEEDDMGYTLLYGGYKTWKVLRKVDYIQYQGITDQDNHKYELEGDGWIAGYRDVSTFDVELFSILFQTGLWYQHLPISRLKSDGVKSNNKEDVTAGFGGELGLGVAFEDIGLSVVASMKLDVTATVLKDTDNKEDIAGAGYGQFFLSLNKDFSI